MVPRRYSGQNSQTGLPFSPLCETADMWENMDIMWDMAVMWDMTVMWDVAVMWDMAVMRDGRYIKQGISCFIYRPAGIRGTTVKK